MGYQKKEPGPVLNRRELPGDAGPCPGWREGLSWKSSERSILRPVRQLQTEGHSLDAESEIHQESSPLLLKHHEGAGVIPISKLLMDETSSGAAWLLSSMYGSLYITPAPADVQPPQQPYDYVC
jgi:hypothetical protein